ncbi:hypothetical protein, partial [Mesorhizobium sp.]|uniref:hypothetical protein n=1 Tax=Mesorhizobium sp. TaxID=1871066 RepID=UPI0025DF2066
MRIIYAHFRVGATAKRLKRVAFDRPHATHFRFLFYACRYRKTAAHPRFKPEGMLLRDMHYFVVTVTSAVTG